MESGEGKIMLGKMMRRKGWHGEPGGIPTSGDWRLLIGD